MLQPDDATHGHELWCRKLNENPILGVWQIDSKMCARHGIGRLVDESVADLAQPEDSGGWYVASAARGGRPNTW